MSQLPVLYKETKTGSVQQWSIVAFEGKYTTLSGKVGGILTPHSTTCEGKNLGRANEKSPTDQAIKEAKAKHTKQKDKGYSTDPSGKVEVTLPPLAKKVQDYLSSIEWPWLGLYKLDGVRCTMFLRDGEVYFQSRGGKSFPVIKNIAKELMTTWFSKHPQLVIDGELYNHGMCLEDIVSAVKATNEGTHKLRFFVFDVYNPLRPDLPYATRYKTYKADLAFAEVPLTYVTGIAAIKVTSEEHMWELHDAAVAQDFEGIVMRDPQSIFKFNYRTSEFLKLKVPVVEEFLCIGMSKAKNGVGVPICQVQVGHEVKTFKAPFKGDQPFRQNLLTNSQDYIGKHLTVSYEKLSKYGKPAKPIGKAFRDVDSDGNVLI